MMVREEVDGQKDDRGDATVEEEQEEKAVEEAVVDEAVEEGSR